MYWGLISSRILQELFRIGEKLPERIDLCQPDYSIYPLIPKDYAYGFLTRGCPNKCKWCVVPKKEGSIRPYMDVEQIAIEGRNKLVLMDNNFLAAGGYARDQLNKIIWKGYRIDFNQALDARLVDDSFAEQLAQVKWLDKNRIRFGCDTHGQIKECERAMDMIISYGFKGEFFLYTMLNDDFQECYERIHYWWERLRTHAIAMLATGCMPTHSHTVIHTIRTVRYHNGRRIWQTGSTRRLTLWLIALRNSNLAKDSDV